MLKPKLNAKALFFKVINGVTPKIINGLFKLSKLTYNLRYKRDFVFD